jgi:hypothetical protein
MTTESQNDVDVSQIPDAFAEAWAAVFIDVYEKVKARGELPDDDEPTGSEKSSTTNPGVPS